MASSGASAQNSRTSRSATHHNNLFVPRSSHHDDDNRHNDSSDMPALCAVDDLVERLGDRLHRIVCYFLRVYLAISCASVVLISRSSIGSAGATLILRLPSEASQQRRYMLRLNPTAAPGLLGQLPWEGQLLHYVSHAPPSHLDYNNVNMGIRVMRALYNFHHRIVPSAHTAGNRYPGVQGILLNMQQYAVRLVSAQNHSLSPANWSRQKIIRLLASHQLMQSPANHQAFLNRWVAQAETVHSRLVHAHLDVNVKNVLVGADDQQLYLLESDTNIEAPRGLDLAIYLVLLNLRAQDQLPSEMVPSTQAKIQTLLGAYGNAQGNPQISPSSSQIASLEEEFCAYRPIAILYSTYLCIKRALEEVLSDRLVDYWLASAIDMLNMLGEYGYGFGDS